VGNVNRGTRGEVDAQRKNSQGGGGEKKSPRNNEGKKNVRDNDVARGKPTTEQKKAKDIGKIHREG